MRVNVKTDYLQNSEVKSTINEIAQLYLVLDRVFEAAKDIKGSMKKSTMLPNLSMHQSILASDAQ